MKKKASKKELVLNVTEEEYNRKLAKGIDPEAIPKPGKHRFERGGFFHRHNIKPGEIDTSSKNTKIAISIRLDGDILEYFKKCAESPGSAAYQTLINEALREHMERKRTTLSSEREQLINDDAFIDAIATRIKQKRSKSASR